MIVIGLPAELSTSHQEGENGPQRLSHLGHILDVARGYARGVAIGCGLVG